MQAGGQRGLVVERVVIEGFRGFERFELDLSTESELGGAWTCIAGINGAGKTSLLQALCLGLLGERHALQLGTARLDRMRRVVNGEARDATIHVTLRIDGEPRDVAMRLTSEGPYRESPDAEEVWRLRERHVLVSYGATRNLSDYVDPRHASLGQEIRRQMSLFDPLTQVASADVLLEGTEDPRLRRMFVELVERAFFDDLAVHADDGGVTFGPDRLDALQLPDGFRSSMAWLADLLAAWCAKHPKGHALEDVRGVALIDEIDLHLHPTLQRTLVPRLREALPGVQFVVTTHSPLVLASFTRAELRALDASEPSGLMPLDREIVGFSTDDVYEWLMGTTPVSAALEPALAGRVPALSQQDIAQRLEMSKDVDEQTAKQRVERRRELKDKLGIGKKR